MKLPQIKDSDLFISIRIPDGIIARNQVLGCIDHLSLSSTVSLRSVTPREFEVAIEKNSGSPNKLCKLFSCVNGFPYFEDELLSSFRETKNPQVTCVVLVGFNDLFVRQQLLPSIIANSKDYEIEIVIINAGYEYNIKLPKAFPIHNSDFGWISRAYNLGGKLAKGDFIAFFHDDCVLNDPKWLDKSASAINGGLTAVTGALKMKEYTVLGLQGAKFQIAKATPLVIERDVFHNFAYFDENYYIGFEDLDFTYNLLSKGLSIGQVDIDIIHLGGASTAIGLSNCPEVLSFLIANNMLPLESIYSCLIDSWESCRNIAQLRHMDLLHMNYFFKKFKAFLGPTFSSYEVLVQELLKGYSTSKKSPRLDDKEGLIRIWKSIIVPDS